MMKSRLRLFLDEREIKLTTGRFPDGAVWLKVDETMPKMECRMRIRVAGMATMDDFMLLAQLVDAVRHACDVSFSHLELAWLPWARQDRHMQPGDSFALKVFARHLNALGFDRVRVLDPHSEAAGVIDNLVVIPQEHCLLQSQELRDALASRQLLPVAPDAGALKKIYSVVKASGAGEFAIMSKQRDVVTGNLSGFALVAGNVADRDLLIVDDLCDGGGTFIGAAQVLKASGARSVSLYVTHGVFSKGVAHLLEQGIDRIYTTDSYAEASVAQDGAKVISIDDIYTVAQGE